MPGIQDLPNDQQVQVRIPAEATAGSDDTWSVWVPEYNATVTAVSWTPDAAVTGSATSFSLQLKDGSTGITTAKTYSGGVNSVANTTEAYTVTAANANVTAADVINWVRVHTSTGQASPAGLLVITYRLR